MGQSLTVASDASDEWIRSLAEAVDEKIRNIRANSHNVNSINLAIMAALNFAEELARLRQEHRELVSRIENLSRRLSQAVNDESAIAPANRTTEHELG